MKEDVAITNENYTIISKIRMISFRREKINGSYCKLCDYLDFSFFQFPLRPLTFLQIWCSDKIEEVRYSTYYHPEIKLINPS